jgi:hypothetical protein
MKLPIAFATALQITGFVTASTEKAGAVVYCQYVGYPAHCVVRPGVVLAPRPVARAAARAAWNADEPWRAGRSHRRALTDRIDSRTD